jgi:hypothetical protein
VLKHVRDGWFGIGLLRQVRKLAQKERGAAAFVMPSETSVSARTSCSLRFSESRISNTLPTRS